MKVQHIDIGRDFAAELGARYRKDGQHSGQEFREDVLEPALRHNDVVVLSMDSIGGYSASFFEEALGGLVRTFGYDQVRAKLRFDATQRAYLIPILENWLKEAASPPRAKGKQP